MCSKCLDKAKEIARRYENDNASARLDDAQCEILQGLKGFGSKDAEIIRNIIIAYLSEKSYLKKASEKE